MVRDVIIVFVVFGLLVWGGCNLADKFELTNSIIERGVLVEAVGDVYAEQSTDLTSRVIEWNSDLAWSQYWTSRPFASWFFNSGWLALEPIALPKGE